MLVDLRRNLFRRLRAVWLASALTSLATTANPRPLLAGARRFDGGVRASRLCWLAMFGQRQYFADLVGAGC